MRGILKARTGREEIAKARMEVRGLLCALRQAKARPQNAPRLLGDLDTNHSERDFDAHLITRDGETIDVRVDMNGMREETRMEELVEKMMAIGEFYTHTSTNEADRLRRLDEHLSDAIGVLRNFNGRLRTLQFATALSASGEDRVVMITLRASEGLKRMGIALKAAYSSLHPVRTFKRTFDESRTTGDSALGTLEIIKEVSETKGWDLVTAVARKIEGYAKRKVEDMVIRLRANDIIPDPNMIVPSIKVPQQGSD